MAWSSFFGGVAATGGVITLALLLNSWRYRNDPRVTDTGREPEIL